MVFPGRSMQEHPAGESCLECSQDSWSRNNRYLLSASLDSTCIIWDLSILRGPSLLPHTPLTAAGPSRPAFTPLQRVHTIRFDAPVHHAVFHPRTAGIVLVTLACNEVVLVDLRGRGKTGHGKGKGKEVLRDIMEGEDGLVEEMEQDVAGYVHFSLRTVKPNLLQHEHTVLDPSWRCRRVAHIRPYDGAARIL